MRIRVPVATALVMLVFAISSLQAQSRQSLLQSIGENPAWTAAGSPKQYGESDIQTLAGKTAPTITRYGLIGVTVQSWNGGSGQLRLTLYEMLDASAAYGLFTFERNIEQKDFSVIPLGTEAFRTGNRTFFWQSKYVVKLEGDPDSANALGRVVSEKIFGRSRKPPVSEHLPLKNLVPGSEKYVVSSAGLDTGLGLDASKLGFDDDLEIAIGRYQLNDKTASLVLLLYPTQQLAKRYLDQWDAESPNEQPFRKRVGPLIGWIRGSTDPAIAQEIFNDIGYESKITWNEQTPDLSLRHVVLTIFTFIGIALFFTVIAGVGFGGLRIFVKARYPDRIFDRSADLEVIQLKLDQGLTRKQIGS